MAAPIRLQPTPFTLAVLTALSLSPEANAVSPNVVISQVYGGGGNTGAPLQNDFVELFNRGTAAVNITGWSLQYSSAAGTSWGNQKTTLSGTIQPGGYFLVKLSGGSSGTALPAADGTGTTNLSATTGKIALVNSTTSLPATTCPASSSIVDLVGYGTSANCFEGAAAAPAPSNTTADLRQSNGCTETDKNNSDFATGTPKPRNAASPVNSCGAAVIPAVSGTTPANGATNVAVTSNIVVSFNEPVNVSAGAITLECPAGTVVASNASALSNVTSAQITPASSLPNGTSCLIKVAAVGISDANNAHPNADFSAGFTTAAAPLACSTPDTAIGLIQGSGASAALSGTQTVQGVVVGDYEYPGTGTSSNYLRGFYLQNATDEDNNPATSDGIFIADTSNSVSLGQVVQVTGTVSENNFSSAGGTQTQITATTIENCGLTGTVTPVNVNLPFPTADYPERFEGMLVRMPQTLYVTEHYQLGRFGQILMSSGDRLPQPTSVSLPGAQALAKQAANDLNQVIVDDDLQNQNPDPILFGRGGNPLSAGNTLRGGDTITGLVGVLGQTDATTATTVTSTTDPVTYRLRPVNALSAGVPNFQPGNPRPAVPTHVNGSLRVASANLLNFFNTFGLGACTNGVGGTATDCRGADSQAEFDRQWPKTVANLVGTGADVLIVNEMENDGYGSTSAIQFLVDKLNAATAPGTYAFINPDIASGQTNSLGTDAIKVGMLYKTGKVRPVGITAPLNTGAFGLFQTGAGTIGRSRPALAQAFEEIATSARFIAVGNHLKSKGSSCADNISPVGPDPDALDGQGNCNLTRKAAAEQLVSWLLTDPTGTNDGDILIAGDLNSYASEDPVTALKNGGYVNLIESRIGGLGYSYAFDGQWGYLDHALASPSLSRQVSDVLEWHINADEPSVLDYNTNFKTANLQTILYAQDAFRTSDHDPIVVGLNLTASPLNVITGTAGADTLVGTAGPDMLIGLTGADTLTGAAGSDQFVYNRIQDGLDTIADFSTGSDKIVLTPLLQGIGIASANPLTAGYVICTDSGTDGLISIDPDAAGPALKSSLVLVKNVGCSTLNATTNFSF
ncbi:MAG: ExeM/NucH family extracellular endonuclease [Methylococcaceae bacterium]|nr:ExeM/NucH family extracellular endonuclease [Methylococcaceae bacterium]